MSILKKIFTSISNKKEISSVIQDKPIISTSNDNINITKVEIEKSKVINDYHLGPVEILMLDYADGMNVLNTTFPGYWNYRYNVNASDVLKKIVELKLLEIDNSILTNLIAKSINELKQLLKDNGLKLSGNKDELINRLIENIPTDVLENVLTNQYYKLTEKGQEILNKNQHVKFFHQNPNFEISIYEAHDIKNKNINYNHFDIAWHLLSISSREHATKGNWGLYIGSRFNMAKVANLENKLKSSLDLLFEVCYLSLSGLGNNFNPNLMDIYEGHFFPYKKSLHTLTPGVINMLVKTKVKLKYTDEDLKKAYWEFIESYQLPFHLFTKDEVLDIIICEINNDKESVSKIYEIAEKRYFNNN